MTYVPWVMISVGVLIVLLGVIVLVNRRKERPPTDYYSMYIIGIVWIAVGLVQMDEMPFFFMMGLVFMAVGLSHKSEWKQNHRRFKDLPQDLKKTKMAAILIGLVVLVIGITTYLLLR